TDLGEKIVIGGWINPTTYSIDQTFIPIFSTRNGPGQPILYISLYQGRLRLMLYNNAGTLIYDTSETPSISFVNNDWYFITTIINRNNKTIQNFIGDRSNGTTWQSLVRNYTGELNEECTADIVMGMLQDTYYYAGGFDDWFFEKDSKLTMEDIHFHFKSSIQANGGDNASQVDALTEPGAVIVRKEDNKYPSSGVLYTVPNNCSLDGNGIVSVTSEYIAGSTAISLIETSASDDVEDWTSWQTIGTTGELMSSNRA